MKLIEVIEKNAQRIKEIVDDAKKRGLTKKQFSREVHQRAQQNKQGFVYLFFQTKTFLCFIEMMLLSLIRNFLSLMFRIRESHSVVFQSV